MTTNKEFWNFIKPFLTNKGFSKNNDITLKNKKEIVTDEKKLADLFNSHYIHIVEITSGIKPETISSTCRYEIQHIVNLYKDHPSIKQIKKKIIPESNEKKAIFPFKPTTVENVKKLLNEIHTKKAVGIDTIPLKLIKMASKFLAPIYTTAINSNIENSVFRKNVKVATAVPLDKGKPDKNDISNFRPVILLNTFSKFYERVIKHQLVLSMENYFSPMTYKKNYRTQHVITRLVEVCRERLDENFVVGAVLTDLSKAFDWIAYDLLIAKLAAYGFSHTALRYIYSYLSNRKQCVRINNTYSNYQKRKSGVPQGSILGQIFFNLSINDLFFFVSDVWLQNFADDNTLSAFAETILETIDVLQSGSEIIIDWFNNNKMIVNPDKFQAILLDKKKKVTTKINEL